MSNPRGGRGRLAESEELKLSTWPDAPDSSPGRSAGRTVRALGMASLFALATCTSHKPPPKPRPTTVLSSFMGTIIGTNSDAASTFVFPQQSSSTLPDPTPGLQGQSLSFAFWGGDGEPEVVVNSRKASRLYAYDGTRTAPISPLLSPQFQPTSPPINGLLVSPGCGSAHHVLLLDLERPRVLRNLADGCPAALSPNGEWLAFSPDARSVWQERVDGRGAASKLIDLNDSSLVSRLGLKAPRISKVFALMAWGPQGMAVVLEDGVRFDILIRETAGAVSVVPLGKAQPTGLAWQPDGPLLAYTDRGEKEAKMRVFDIRTKRSRALATGATNGFFGLVWSPDGLFVVSLTEGESGAEWLFASSQGGVAGTVQMLDDTVPFDWSR